MNSIIFVVDVKNLTGKLIVNGTECMVGSLKSGIDVLSELQIGSINAGTKQNRFGHYRSAVAFNRPLSGDSLTALSDYLESKKA